MLHYLTLSLKHYNFVVQSEYQKFKLLVNVIPGDSVDEVSAHVKKHDAFEKLMATQEEKVTALQEHGDKLLAQNHFESGLIAHRLNEVVQRRAKVKELCAMRKIMLDEALLHAQFVRDVAEVCQVVLSILFCKQKSVLRNKYYKFHDYSNLK